MAQNQHTPPLVVACLQVGKTVELLSAQGDLLRVRRCRTPDGAFSLQRKLDARTPFSA